MKLSVLITTYNLEKYIDEALNSVVGQKTDYDYEIIIGDDGSTDRTISIIEMWEDKYPGLIKHFVMERDEKKKYNPIFRASANRLKIASYAKGEYLIFLDGDDFYTDFNKFQKQIDILEMKKNSDCSICVHNMNLYFENENRVQIMQKENALKEGKMKSGLFWSKYYLPAEACVFRNFLKQEEFKRIDTKYFDDNIIVFLGLSMGNVYYINDVMANYRQHDTYWRKTSVLKANIINLMDYDLEIRINPRLRRSSLLRHFSSFKYVARNIKKLDKIKMNRLWSQACLDGAKTVKRMFEYNDMNLIRRFFFWIWAIKYELKYFFYKIIQKLFCYRHTWEDYFGKYNNKKNKMCR